MVVRARKKPVVIEAIRFSYDNADEIKEWTSIEDTCSFNWGYEEVDVVDGFGELIVNIDNLWGQVYDNLHDTWINVYPGQWIIKGIQGEFYPCANDVFEDTYEVIND